MSTGIRWPTTNPRQKKGIEEERRSTVSRDTGHEIGIHRIIDRRGDNPRYYERVVDKETGEEIRLVDESLQEHRGRGDARRSSTDR
jgi:hypothetical protein